MSSSKTTRNRHLDALKTAYTHKPFQCPSGTLEVADEDLILYYGKDKSTGIYRLDFKGASDKDLKELADNCDPATFGRNQEDVLDETYRSAGKLDVTHFSTLFDPAQSGVIGAIQDVLLEGYERTHTALSYKLYKLNVYGPGQFFKAHKDTPRGDKMFASLVVVLPTKHEGGALILRHEDTTFTFDSGVELAKSTEPSVGFAAFYSDIEHEVSPVISGYRVTLTYNLYFHHSSPSPAAPLKSAQDSAIRAALTALMEDADYLPEGGFVGFGLRHEYALSHDEYVKDTVKPFLKGSDAVLARVSEELGLETSVWVEYKDSSTPILCSRRIEIGSSALEIDLWKALHLSGGLLLEPLPDYCKYKADLEVQWATSARTAATWFEENYAYYGNEPGHGAFYGHLCFLVHLGPSHDRLSPLRIPKKPDLGWEDYNGSDDEE
ncbi:hypothetical protein BC835DRAFT_1553058 [Cytidiella melzeri]|nr:hypothetical protein BC835DRAFT_1553058 [Cytidiella melzeri]